MKSKQRKLTVKAALEPERWLLALGWLPSPSVLRLSYSTPQWLFQKRRKSSTCSSSSGHFQKRAGHSNPLPRRRTHPLPRVLPWSTLPLIGYTRGPRELERQSTSSRGPPLLLLPWSTRNLPAPCPTGGDSWNSLKIKIAATLPLHWVLFAAISFSGVSRERLCLILHLRVLLGPPKDPSANAYGSAQRRLSNKSTP